MSAPSTEAVRARSPERRKELSRKLFDVFGRRPDVFAEKVFGVELWSRQRELLQAVAQHRWVSVRSGHKVAKSFSAAVLALWWACTRKQGTVVLVAPTTRQVERIIWPEVQRLHKIAAKRLGGRGLGGQVYSSAEHGILWDCGRSIFGTSADIDKERAAGFSGNLLYILDEASGIRDEIHEVFTTNVAGHILMISNPTMQSGAFFESHHGHSQSWHTMAISSEEVARENVMTPSGDWRWPFLANADWVAARKAEYGEKSPYYDVRVRGQFSQEANNQIVTLAQAEAARDRWSETPPTVGRSEFGIDVARFGADDSSIAWRRGAWAARPVVLHGIDTVTLAGRALSLIDDVRLPGETPIVRIDTSNGAGGGVADIMRRREDIEVVDVYAFNRSEKTGLRLVRDELWIDLRDWLKDGAIPDDKLLIQDIVTPTFDYDPNGRLTVEPKPRIRQRLKRSTDRADALALSVYSKQGDVWDAQAVTWGSR